MIRCLGHMNSPQIINNREVQQALFFGNNFQGVTTDFWVWVSWITSNFQQDINESDHSRIMLALLFFFLFFVRSCTVTREGVSVRARDTHNDWSDHAQSGLYDIAQTVLRGREKGGQWMKIQVLREERGRRKGEGWKGRVKGRNKRSRGKYYEEMKDSF